MKNRAPESPGRPIRTLVVSHSHEWMGDLAETFKNARTLQVVAIAFDGVEALVQLADSCAKLVLIDMDMPHIAGPIAVRAIKTHVADVRVIALSKEDVSATPKEYRDCGADAFLRKHEVADLLQPTVERLFPPADAAPTP